MKKYETVNCQICDKEKKTMEVVKVSKIRKSIADNIKKEYPQLDPAGCICTSCLNTYRREHITHSLQLEKGALTALDKEVINSIKNEKMLVTKIYEKIDERSTKGDRLADKVAEIGGSWRFIIIIFLYLQVG